MSNYNSWDNMGQPVKLLALLPLCVPSPWVPHEIMALHKRSSSAGTSFFHFRDIMDRAWMVAPSY